MYHFRIMSDHDELKKQAIKDVIGKSWEDAQQIFKEKYPSLSIRCNWKDGNFISSIKNLDWKRLNVGIQNGIVMEKYGHGVTHDGYESYHIPMYN